MKRTTATCCPAGRATCLSGAVLLALSLASCSGDSMPPVVSAPPPAASADEASLAVGVLTPLPPPLQARYETARRQRAEGEMAAALETLEQVLAELEGAWGAGDTRLEPYDYDRCILLREAGRLEDSLAAARRWLAAHPRSLHHRVLEATTLLRLSELAGRVESGAREAICELARPGNRDQLKRYGVEPADSLLGLAGVALVEQDWQVALELLEIVAGIPGHRERAQTERARILLETQEPAEALAALEDAGSDLDTRLLRARAHLALGQAGRAWQQIETEAQTPAPISPAQSRSIAITGARALLELDRTPEARDLVLGHLLEHSTDIEGIRLLAACMRKLALGEVAEQLERRARELAAHDELAEQVRKAENANNPGTAAYLRAIQLLLLDRTGDALREVDAFVSSHDDADYLHLLSWDVQAQLGLTARAIERAQLVCGRGGSPLLVLGLARLRARLGDGVHARELLQSTSAVRAPTPRLQGLLEAYRLRLLLELGELEAAAALLPGVEAAERADAPHPVAEIRILAQTELGLHAGAADAQSLAQTFDTLDGGAAWAGALRSVIEIRQAAKTGAPVLTIDPSDLLANPRLLDLIGDAGAPLRELHRSMLELQRKEALAELHELCMSRGCRRRARQLAWYLWSRDSGSIESELRLALTLDRPQELVDRLAAAERGLAPVRLAGNAPGDVVDQLREIRKRARAQLGYVE